MKGSLKLTNTLGGTKEVFEPLEPGHARMYVCGLTVYSRGHIGNFRTFVSLDVLRRYLEYRGYRVTEVMNFTDIDDKTILGASEAGLPLQEYTDRFIEYFYEDADALHIERAEHYPRATDPVYLDAMIELVKKLKERGHTYQADGSTYFRISTFPGYGKLSRIDLEGVQSGARVDTDDYAKEDARDFVLWKGAKENEPSWDSPFGPGRPGWHLECSAMSTKLLGDSFDLHGGGVDLIFPHHENEIAQSEGATGKPFVRHWFHGEFLLVEGEKMAKSKGNQFTVRELVDEGFSPEGIRYLLLSTHYRKQLNFSRDGVRQAEQAVRRVDDFLSRLGEVETEGPMAEEVAGMTERALAAFEEAMDDDLNTSGALAALFDLVREGNIALSSSSMTKGDAAKIVETIERMNTVFAVFGFTEAVMLDQEVEELIVARREARAKRDFARADAIRERLDQQGIVLEDGPAGTRWRRK